MAGSAAPVAYVFGYGSLLHPRSLHRTLPEIEPLDCIPGTARGMVRCFDVAFPNDGSQPDKAYFAADGLRPPRILLCNLRPSAGRGANGICIPVTARELDALRDRERRYSAADITELVTTYSTHPTPLGPVLAFLGRTEFTGPADVGRGVLSADYRDTILSGVDYWDQHVAGFAEDFHTGTQLPPTDRVQRLRRVDLGAT